MTGQEGQEARAAADAQGGVCEHGSLERQCLVCELSAAVGRLREDNAAAEAQILCEKEALAQALAALAAVREKLAQAESAARAERERAERLERTLASLAPRLCGLCDDARNGRLRDHRVVREHGLTWHCWQMPSGLDDGTTGARSECLAAALTPAGTPADDGQGPQEVQEHHERAGGAGAPAARSPLMEEVAALLAAEADRVIAAFRDSPAPSSHSEPDARVSALERVAEAARRFELATRVQGTGYGERFPLLDALTSAALLAR